MFNWSQSNFKIIGHRGCRGPLQENSPEAISWAFNHGADAVEVDLWLVENEIVVVHDRRCTNYLASDALISDVSLEELRSVMDVPTLKQVLEIVPKEKGINLEVKDPSLAKRCANDIQSLVDSGVIHWNQILFSSFDHRIIEQIKHAKPSVNIAMLTSSIQLDLVSYAQHLNVCGVNFDVDCLSEDIVAEVRGAGLAVYVYTVNSLQDALELKRWGVDGIICDNAEKMVAVYANAPVL